MGDLDMMKNRLFEKGVASWIELAFSDDDYIIELYKKCFGEEVSNG